MLTGGKGPAQARRSGRPAFDYGFEPGRSFQGFDVHLNGMHATFSVTGPMGQWTGLELPMPGRHNVLNALGALAAAWRLGLDERSIRAGLATCERVGRRFEVKGTVRGVRVVDDYGHHPAEIEATLRAGRASTSGRIGVLFQPHRFTRTAALLDEFARCFAESGAQAVFVQPVYAASESPIPGADHRTLAREIKRLGHPCASAVKDRAAGVKRLLAWAQPGDTVLVQGAGDVTAAAEELLAGLRKLEA